MLAHGQGGINTNCYVAGNGRSVATDEMGGMRPSGILSVAMDSMYYYWEETDFTPSDFYVFPGMRPVICLKSGVKLQANASDGYDLIQPDVVVTENQATLEITAEESNTFDSLFTVTTKDGGTATRTYKLNGTTTNIRNTSELTAGTYTITCTATYNGVSDTASVTIVVKSALPKEDTLLATVIWSNNPTYVTIPEGVSRVLIKEIEQSGKGEPGNFGEESGLWEEINYAEWCAKGAGWAVVTVEAGATYCLSVFECRHTYEIYYGEDIEKGKPIVTFTAKTDYDNEASGESAVMVEITSEVELNFEKCYYSLASTDNPLIPVDETTWENMNSYVSWNGMPYVYNVPSYSFTAKAVMYGGGYYLRLRLEDVYGNIYYYVDDNYITMGKI